MISDFKNYPPNLIIIVIHPRKKLKFNKLRIPHRLYQRQIRRRRTGHYGECTRLNIRIQVKYSNRSLSRSQIQLLKTHQTLVTDAGRNHLIAEIELNDLTAGAAARIGYRHLDPHKCGR